MTRRLLLPLTLLVMSATLSFAQEDSALLDRYFYTFHNPAGNHFVRGSGSFPDVNVIDIPLRGKPAWGRRLCYGNGSLACRNGQWRLASCRGRAGRSRANPGI